MSSNTQRTNLAHRIIHDKNNVTKLLNLPQIVHDLQYLLSVVLGHVGNVVVRSSSGFGQPWWLRLQHLNGEVQSVPVVQTSVPEGRLQRYRYIQHP